MIQTSASLFRNIITQRGIENGGYVMFVRKYKCTFEVSEENVAAMDDSRGSRTKLYIYRFLFICLMAIELFHVEH